MSAAYDRLASGYYNPAPRSSGNPGGLAGQGAVRDNLELMLADIAAVIGEGAMSAEEAMAAAASAWQAPGSKSTSVTPMNIPALGATVVVPIVEADRVYAQGQTAVVSVTGQAAKQFAGTILGWNAALKQLSVLVQFVAGAGNYATWTIALTAPIDDTLTGRVTALEQANARGRELALFIGKEFI